MKSAICLAILLVVFPFGTTVSAATYTVTSTADTGAGSLRQAVADASTQAGGSTIVFAPALSGQTITLASQITVNDVFGAAIDVTIDATSLPGGLTISGNNVTRIFTQRNASSSLTLRGLTLTGGNDANNGGAIRNEGALTLVQCILSGNSARYAGAIDHDKGTLTMTQCTLSGNSANDGLGWGGAIYIGGNCTVALTQCTLSGNSTSSYGGAIFTSIGSTLTLTQCIFARNSAPSRSGGAIHNQRSVLTMTECTFSENTAGSGGAILNDVGPMTQSRCTFSRNSATSGYGGAISNDSGTQALTLMQCTLTENSSSGGGGAISSGNSILVLTQCTLSGNTAGSGGGGAIFNDDISTLTITNSIVAGNTASTGADIRLDGGTLIRAGANLIGNNDTVTAVFPAAMPNSNGDYAGTVAAPLNAQLAPLASNGGPTQTMALLPGSLARNHAAVLFPPQTADQRGRPIIDAPDIGAYENQFGVLIRPLLIPSGTPSGSFFCHLETDGPVTANSSNAALIPNESIAITGSGLSRTITITPAAGQIGISTLVLTHSPSGETDTFQVYALPEGYVVASIGDIADQTTNEDVDTVDIPFAVADSASVFGLTVNATSSNTTLVPNTSIVLGGTDASRSLSVTPAANQNGATTITVTVTDGATTASDSFLLTVNSVNDAPSFAKGADQITSSSVAGARSVSGWATALSKGPADETAQTLSFISTNDNNTLFTVQPAVSPTGTLSYTPVTGAEGTVTVSASLLDSGGTAHGGVNTSAAQTFTIMLVTATTPTVVTSAADSGPGTLRQIVSIAAAKTGPDVITFAPALSGQTITLASQIAVGNGGMTVDATALPDGLTISGNNTTRIFRHSGSLTLRGLHLTNGNATGASNSGFGGAIYKTGGILELTQCTLSGNSATNQGGAIYNGSVSDVLILTQCTLSGNSTTSGSGGAIYNGGGLTLTMCTLSGNSTASGHGGAIYSINGTLKLTHCTLAGNLASSGGAISIGNNSALTLTHCSISGNSAGSGGAITNSFGSTLTLTNSIVAGNSATTGADFNNAGGSLQRTGVNLVGKNSTVTSAFPAGAPNLNGNYVGTSASPLNPQLAPLGNYGGPTQTRALLPSSLARNHATVLSPVITADQRGFPIVGAPDIGAYEAGTTNTFAVWSLENTGVALSFGGDTDHDNLPDGLEYATRTSPTATNVNPLTGPEPIAGPAMQFSLPYRTGATDLRYIVQRSTDLASWTEIYRYDTSTGLITEVGVVADENSATETITITDPASGSANFWRVRVELVP